MDDHLNQVASVRDLEEAVAFIFQNNFDADSRVCLVTLMKMIDNILHKPGNDKVRTIRLENAAFHSKVGCRQGALEFLQACGFVRQSAPPPLLRGAAAAEANGDEQLVLPPERENQPRLILARRLLMTRAIQDLGMPPDQLPVYRPPPPPITITSTGSASRPDTAVPADGSFNPYVGHRFDAKSAAVGTNLGPDANYVSKTESELQRLQEQQEALEAKLQPHTGSALDRAWRAWGPNEAIPAVDDIRAFTDHTEDDSTAATSATNGISDSSLLAQRLKKQQEERFQREQGGFTTKAMRDLERLKKQKVYTHVSLTIQFPDGYKVMGKFLPKEKIATVKRALQNDCFLVDTTNKNGSVSTFDLYVTPPRRLLPDGCSLKDEGLVPAAKIFVGWKGLPPSGAYLQPSLWQASDDGARMYPDGKSIVAAAAESAAAKKAKTDASSQQPDSDAREAALMRRMLGKSGASKPKTSGSSSSNNNNKPASGNKPKWFKS